MRKEIVITIPDRGRSLTFKVREMSAEQGEAWMWRAFFLLCKSGAANIEEIQKAVYSALNGKGGDMQSIGLLISALGGVNMTDAKPLLDELLACCSRVVDGIEQQCLPGSMDGYIEEKQTILRLRYESVKLNFFSNVSQSESRPSEKPQPDSSKKRGPSVIKMSQA